MRISDWSADVCSSDLPSPATQERGWLSAIRQARKFIGLVLLRQPLDQRVQRALEHVGQVVQRQALHPMVGDPALRVVVGADALAAVAAADLQLARGGGGGRLLLGFGLGQHRLEALHRLVAVGVLRALGLRSEEHTSELQSLMRISYAVFCLKKNT